MRKVGIVVDSATDFPLQLVKELDLGVAPVVLIADDEPTIMTPDVDRTRFIDRMENCKKFSTSGANAGDFYAAYEDILARAEKLVVLTLAKELSVTYNAAVAAAEMIEGRTVKVYDCRGLFAGHTAMAVAAARKALAGASFEDVCAYVEAAIPSSQTLIISPNLAFIRGVGRVTEEGGSETREVKLAIVRIAQGKIVPIDAAADYDEAIDKVVALAEAAVGGEAQYGAIIQARQNKGAAALKRALEGRVKFRELVEIDEAPIGVVLGGIGSVALGFARAR